MMGLNKRTMAGGLLALLTSAGIAEAAGTIVPYTKHNTRVVVAYVWRIPVVYISWDWEMSFKKLPYPGTPPTNLMSGLSGVDQMGDTTTLAYMSNMINMNQLVLEDGMGGVQTFTITSGSVDYTTGPNIAGTASMAVTGLTISGTLDSADIFGLGSEFHISFLNTAEIGSIFLGDPNGPEVLTTLATGLMANTHISFPSAVLNEDREGYSGIGDWSGPFEIPAPAGAMVLCGAIILGVVRRR